MSDFRRIEIAKAISIYRMELDMISMKRLELARQEKEAWGELRNVLLADAPEELSPYFAKFTPMDGHKISE